MPIEPAVVPPVAAGTALSGEPATPPAAVDGALAVVDPAATPAAVAPVAPEPFALKLPEGIKLEDLGGYEALAKELKLDNASAQKAADHFLRLDQARQTKQAGELDSLHQSWKAALKTDKEVGGSNFDASKAAALKALAKYGDPELQQLVAGNPIGDHPALFRFIARIGKAMAEDSVAGASSGSPVASTDESRLKAMFPTMFKE